MMLIEIDEEGVLVQVLQEDILNLIDYGGILVDEKETVKAYLTVLDYNMPHQITSGTTESAFCADVFHCLDSALLTAPN